jgi:hypothetical protein
MDGTLAAIFSLPGSKKWIILDGRTGISRSGSGAPTASGVKKSFGERIDPPSRAVCNSSVTLNPGAGELLR